MSGITGKSGGSQTTRYAGIQVQSSQKGMAIPRGWGTFKASCNLVDYTNFISTVQSSSAGGGKGGSGGKGGGNTYNYTANVLLGITGQQIYGIRSVWRDSNVYIDGTSSSASLAAPFAAAVFSLANTQSGSSSVTSTTSSTTTSALAQAGLSLATGAIGQTACSAVTSSNTNTYWMYNANQTATVLSTSHAIGYSGLAYVYASNYALNSSATIPNHSFEVQSTIRQVIGGVTQDDANPADIINDFLPSVPQWPTGIIGSTAQYNTYCLAAGLLISPYVDSARSGADLLNEILACSNTNVVWSNGQLQFVPYGDTAITANGVTYTPNLTPVYALQWSDILDAAGDDPIKWDIRPQAQCYNYVQVSYLDRTNQYVSDVMPAPDAANIASYGLNKQDPVTLNSICLPTVASQVAQLMVQRSVNIRRTCSFKLPWTFGLLDPMDIVTVPTRAGGTQVVRILEADEKDGEISITAEEMLVGASHAAQYTRQAALPSQNNAMVSPGNASTPLIIHPPASLVSDNEIWIAACSNYELWGGAVVWVSTDGTNYNAVGTLQGPSTMGVLTSALASYGGANPDTTDTLAVDMSMSAEVLQPVTATDAAKGITLAIIDNELVTYQSATLTGINTYSLTSLYRAFGGTAAAAHSSGAPIVFLNGNLFKYKFNANQIGQTLYVKLQSFNIYGGGYQNLATISAYTITLAQTYTSSVAWANVAGMPSNVAALTGSEAINNALVASGTGNMITFSQFEKGTAGWATSASAGTPTLSNFVNYLGLSYIQSTISSFTSGVSWNIYNSVKFPCASGQILAVSGIIGATSGIPATANLTVSWYNASGTYVSSSGVGGAVSADGNGHYLSAIITAPSSAAFGAIVATCVGSGTESSASSVFIAQPMAMLVTSGQTVVPAFTPGPNAIPGADITSANTAAAIAGQGPWATTSSITPGNVIAPNPNMIYNPTGRLGMQGWVNGGTTAIGANQGAGEGYYFGCGGGSNAAAVGYYQDVPCYANAPYSISGYIAAYGLSGTGANVRFYIEWLTSAHALISYSSVCSVGPGTGWTYVTQPNQTSPATAAYARVWIDIYSAGAWTNTNAAWKLLKLEQSANVTPYQDNATYGALYQTGVTIDSLQPAQSGADVTGSNTAAAITGQAATATSSDFASVTGTTKPANNADVTSANTALNTSNVGSITAGSVASTINSGGGVAASQVVTAAMVSNAVSALASTTTGSAVVGNGGSATVASVTVTPASSASVFLVSINFTVLYTAGGTVPSNCSISVTNGGIPTTNITLYPGFSQSYTFEGVVTGLSSATTFTFVLNATSSWTVAAGAKIISLEVKK